MSYREPARTSARRTGWTILVALAVASAGTIGVLDYHSSAASPSSTAPLITAGPSTEPTAKPTAQSSSGSPSHAGIPADSASPAGTADGVVPDGVTILDNDYPAVTNLNPALLGALRQAATVAARDGIQFYVNSGWRSKKYQEQLLQEAIAKYGSEQAAARWVATPDTSAHVSGNAADLGPAAATSWLSRHGAAYGLCQIYRNESWHYELRQEAVDRGCPAMYADPTQDPRMQQ